MFHTLTTSISWNSGVSGDWNTAALWTGNAVPDAADAVTISAAGTYGVTIAAAAVASSITLDSASATLTVDQVLTLSGDLAVRAGALVLSEQGTISGGTLLADAGGQLVLDNGGALLGVDLQGTITLDQQNGSLRLGNGPASGSHDTIDFASTGETLSFNADATLRSTTLTVRSASAGLAANIVDLGMPSSAETFTIGAGSAVACAGDLYFSGSLGNAPSTTTVVNDGTLAATSGGTLGIGNPPYGRDGVALFDNAGRITISGGASFQIGAGMANSGVVDVTGALSTLSVGLAGNVPNPADTLTNTGTIEVSSGGTISLDCAENTATLTSIVNDGGTVIINGPVSGAGTITVPTQASGGTLILGGGNVPFNEASLSGVTVVDPTGNLAFQSYNNVTLTDVSYNGTVNITGQEGISVYDGGGATFAGSDGTGEGAVEFGSLGGTLSSDGTLNNVLINLNNGIIAFEDASAQTPALVLGPTCDVVLDAGNGGRIQLDSASGSIVNEGTISVIGMGSSLGIDSAGNARGTFFINAGQIDVSGGARVIFPENGPVQGTAGLSNSGTIAVTTGGTLQAGDSSFAALTNSGTITADGAGCLIGYGIYGSASNTGLISVSNGATLVLGSDWTNQGVITVTAGSTVDFGGTFTTAAMMSVDVSGSAEIISGQLANSGASVVPGAGVTSLTLAQGADITGGTLTGVAGTLGVASYTFYDYNPAPLLQDVTVRGTLALTQANATLSVSGGLTLEGANGHGDGTVVITGAGAMLEVDVGETLANAVIILGNAQGTAGILVPGTFDPGILLTFGKSTHLIGEGNAVIGGGDLGGQVALANDGIITAAHGQLSLGDTVIAFTNAGTLAARAGAGFIAGAGSSSFTFTDSGVLSATGGGTAIDLLGETTVTGVVSAIGHAAIGLGTLTNVASGTLTGGTYTAASGGIIDIASPISTDAAIITLGQGGTIEAPSTAGGNLALDQMLSSIAAGGTLALQNDDFFNATANAGTFTDSGSMVLNAADFRAHLLTIGQGADLTGTGTVHADTVNLGAVQIASGSLTFLGAFDNAGSLIATGGTVTLGNVSGAGTMQIGGATLAARSATAAQSVRFTGSPGMLDLVEPAAFHAAIANFAAGDGIDLIGAQATTLAYAHDTLTVMNGNATVALLHFSTGESLANFHLMSDNAGGTIIKFS